MSAGSSETRRDVTSYREPVSPAREVPARVDLFDLIADPQQQVQALSRLEAFVGERSTAAALFDWFRLTGVPHYVASVDDLKQLVSRDIARIDEMLDAQTNAIVHAPRFQTLESSWRMLNFLVEQSSEAENVKIRVLNASWEDLSRDADRASEFDQSQLFRKIYTEEFDTPGGEPFGLLIGDYDVRHVPSAEHPVDDLSVLAAISRVAAAAFTPFVTAAHPALFGFDSFTQLESPINLERSFEQLEYLKWRKFREQEDSRFVGLALPRVLARLPYEDSTSRVDKFRFREDVAPPNRSRYLWGNAAYAFASVVVRAFSESGWLAEIRGVERGVEGGGLVTGLPVHSFSTDRRGVAVKSSTEVVITDQQENELGDLGFLPLCDCADTEYSAFYGCSSTQKPKRYDEQAATNNARISSMLQYMLCVSRFAHYVKVIVRDKIGTFAEASQCEDFLHRWLHRYVVADSEASPSIKAEYPLREAKVEVRERPGKPGTYQAVVHLRPHFQLEDLSTTFRLVTELSQTKPS